jgi:hypothetical protein
MATYNSPAVSNNAPTSTHGAAGNVKVARAVVTCAAAPSSSDTMNFFDLPANARIHYALLQASDMDTNGTPLLALNVGYSGSASALFSASAVGQAGTLAAETSVTAQDLLLTSKTRITGTASTNAATGAAGTVTLTVLYSVEG